MPKQKQLTDNEIVDLFLLLLCQLALIRGMNNIVRMFAQMADPIHQAYLRDGSIVTP